MLTNVLVVDDHRTFRESFCAMLGLTFDHLQIVPTHEATAALRLLRQLPFDLLITDYQLNAFTGTQLIRHIQNQSIATNAPILSAILMSSNPDMSVFARTLGVPFLHKPPDRESLVAVVGPLLQRSPSTSAARR